MADGICVNGANNGLLASALTYGSIVLIAPDHRDARHRIAAREPGAHVDDLLVEVARHVAQPREIRTIGLGVAKPWRGVKSVQKNVSLLNGAS